MKHFTFSLKPFVFYLSIVFLLLAGTACKVTFSPPDTVPGPDFPYALMMQEDDLPPGWNRGGGSFPDVPGGAVAYKVGFRHAGGEFGRIISHEAAVYPDVQAAVDAYPEWESQWFNPSWSSARDTAFKPRDPADDVRFEYLDVKINGTPVRSYRYLQRHGNLIALILVNIDGQSITFEQFEETLRRLDARLSEY